MRKVSCFRSIAKMAFTICSFVFFFFFFFFTEFQEELQLIQQSTFVFESQLPNVLCAETGAIIFLHSSSSPNLSLS